LKRFGLAPESADICFGLGNAVGGYMQHALSSAKQFFVSAKLIGVHETPFGIGLLDFAGNCEQSAPFERKGNRIVKKCKSYCEKVQKLMRLVSWRLYFSGTDCSANPFKMTGSP
jgi:hypothetical protein